MSRRKQSNPQHLGTDDIYQNPANSSVDPSQQSNEATHFNESNQSEGSAGGQGITFMCARCQEVFNSEHNLADHSATCPSKHVDIYGDAEPLADDTIMDTMRVDMVDGEDPDTYDDDLCDENKENIDDCNELGLSPRFQSDLDMKDDEMDDDLKDDDVDMAEHDDVGELEDEHEKVASDAAMLSHNLALGNLFLGPLMNTKHAMAQFAENNLSNLSPSEAATLQATLFSLQQQQLMQLQLIQRLQHQLVGQSQSGADGQHPGAQLNGLPSQSLQALTAMLPNGIQSIASQMTPNGMQLMTPPLPSSKSNLSKEANDRHSPREITRSPIDDQTIPNNMSGTKSAFEILRQEAKSFLPVSDNDLPLNLMSNNKTLSSNIDRSVYASDDPFFKHKCRFCQKVFGSDSALQIHIRSHTGERPFKCNICGNRFSTRGNLKVHFSRHRDKYPHIRMNPNPVPEHLDKMHPPLLAQTSLPQEMTPSSLGNYGPTPSTPVEQPRSSSTPLSNDIKTEEMERPEEPLTPVSQPSQGPAIGSEPPALISPDVTSPAASVRNSFITSSHSLPSTPMHHIYSMPPLTSTPLHAPLPLHGHYSMAGMPLPGTLPMMGMENPFFRPPMRTASTKIEDPLEQFMECSKSETSKLEELVQNLDTKLSDPNQCVICHRVLSCKSALQMHYRIHTGERPFKCKICGRAFTTKGNLKTHMGVHRAKPPIRMLHQCPVCHKQFTNSLVLQQHIRMHTTEPSALEMSRHLDFMHGHEMMTGLNHHYGLPHHHPALSMSLPGIRHSLGELDLSNKSRDVYNIRHYEDKSPKPMQRPGSAPLLEKHSPDDSESRRSLQSTPGPTGHPKECPTDDQQEIIPPQSPGSISSQSSDELHPSQPLYSTSLAALEQHVRDMDPSRPNYDMIGHPKPLDMSAGSMNARAQSPHIKSPSPSSGISSQPNSSNEERYKSENGDSQDFTSEHHAIQSVTHSSIIPFGFHPIPFDSEGLGALDLTAGMGDKSTTCNICLKTFACRSALDIHYRSHTRERPFRCNVCDRGFSTKGNMKQHMLTHKIRDLTSEAFSQDSSDSNDSNPKTDRKPEDHQPSYHVRPEQPTASSTYTDEPPEKKPALSPTVPTVPTLPSSSSTTTPVIMSPHMNNSTSSLDNSPFVRRASRHRCMICQKNFSSASALQIHNRTHTGDKPFKCTVCGKAFTTKGNLKVHMGTHMWNNGPSRRGRRIAMDHPIPMPTKEPDFLFGHRTPSELYFPYPAFHNGMPPKMNEIPVIQSMNGSFPHLSISSSTAEFMKMKADAFMSMSGLKPELNLSSSNMSPKDYSTKTSESDPDVRNGLNNNNEGERHKPMVAPKSPEPSGPHNDSAWLWKTTCHLCNKVCSTPSALEVHLQSHVNGMVRDREEPKGLLA